MVAIPIGSKASLALFIDFFFFSFSLVRFLTVQGQEFKVEGVSMWSVQMESQFFDSSFNDAPAAGTLPIHRICITSVPPSMLSVV